MGGFKLDMSGIARNLVNLKPKTMAALEVYGDSVSKEMESYAKSNRPWTDRTGDARKLLVGFSSPLKYGVRCNVRHGVSYGIYLEMCNERRYAILEPTVKAVGPKAISGLDKIFK